MTLETTLWEFARQRGMLGKGALCVALIVTRYARKYGLPLDPRMLLAESGGQVAGLGKTAVQTILKEYGVERVLAEEGGRTSRGSVGNMESYVAFLNDLHHQNMDDLPRIETWWADRVRDFFAAKPFILKYDIAKSLEYMLQDLLAQAEKRQKSVKGSTIAGSALQHLTGAMLEIISGESLSHHGANVADGVSGREGDYMLDDLIIHVTTSPSEALMRKCARNIESGKRPVIFTTRRGFPLAEGLAEQANIGERLDIFDVVQFLASHLHQIGGFRGAARREALDRLIARYNEIVADCETDAGLRIEISR